MRDTGRLSLIFTSLCIAVIPTKIAGQELQELIGSVGGCHYFDRSKLGEVYGFRSDANAREAAERIMRHTGLPQNFTIMAANIKNAEARMDSQGRRLILYNQEFMLRILAGTGTDWSPVSILAHEIGHHLSGHTFTGKGSMRPFELEADKFSGFVLHNMGASIEEAKAAISLISSPLGSLTHPPKDARLAAIANGWLEAKDMKSGTARAPIPPPQSPGRMPRDCVTLSAISEETEPRLCPAGYAVKGVKCSGFYCDNKILECCNHPEPHRQFQPGEWSSWFSEERRGRENYEHRKSMVVVGLKCKGSFCDNISLQFAEAPGFTHCNQTSFFSEEGSGSMQCLGNAFVSGMECKKPYCDDIALYCCSIDSQ